MKYKLGEHIINKNGKLRIADDKKHFISLAKREIKEWTKACEKAKSEIIEWQKFIKELEKRGILFHIGLVFITTPSSLFWNYCG